MRAVLGGDVPDPGSGSLVFHARADDLALALGAHRDGLGRHCVHHTGHGDRASHRRAGRRAHLHRQRLSRRHRHPNLVIGLTRVGADTAGRTRRLDRATGDVGDRHGALHVHPDVPIGHVGQVGVPRRGGRAHQLGARPRSLVEIANRADQAPGVGGVPDAHGIRRAPAVDGGPAERLPGEQHAHEHGRVAAQQPVVRRQRVTRRVVP